MKKIIIIVLMALLLSSCTSGSSFQPIEIDYSDSEIERLQELITVDGYSKLLEELNEAELTVEENGKLNHPALKGTGTYMLLNNEILLNIYEYDHAESLYEGIVSINSDGYGIAEIKDGKIIGGADHEWIDQPNFYLFNNLIILYVGSDTRFITFLNEISDEVIIK